MASGPNRTMPTPIDVETFLAGIADPEKRADSFILAEVMKRLTGKPGVMWGTSIIGFGAYRYNYESGRTGESAKLGFSPRKQTIAIYLMPGFSDLEAQRQRLGKHTIGKSCLYIKRLSEIDMATLEDMLVLSWAAMDRLYPQANP